MPKSRIIITLGAIIAILPLLGFPRLWESFFQVATGLSIVLLSVWTSIDKRLTLKAKAQKRQIHKRRVEEIQSQTEVPQEEVLVQSEPEQNI
ncbi:MAG: hypothetical protein A3H60_01905 [Candidatus Zambryskibacteria bacterium RIFCSPLOWO2_02_FULL_44_12b]|uniref:Uncharacterized protein n=1 Tax=Candidatus Zambryskibacteria bacterium RIFCSPLOWO2_02_FULL_44_12b TaxID=1802772 RepID=A0A1G2UNE8_9BACT|nr:MAG: hypothetical protein A3H60_01905 [Candidatus Zambryskibacteria bacterium RIFCSPLOWO2_02_FULL_44_12b]